MYDCGVTILHNNQILFYGSIVIIATLLAYLAIWLTAGRPKRGVIIPRFEPPHDISPAAMRFLLKKRYDSKIWTITLLTLAAKGLISISEDSRNVYTIILLDDPHNSRKLLPKEESCLLDKLFRNDKSIKLDIGAEKTITQAVNFQQAVIEIKFHRAFFTENHPFAFLGIGFSFLATVLAATQINISLQFIDAEKVITGVVLCLFSVIFFLTIVMKYWLKWFGQTKRQSLLFENAYQLMVITVILFGVGLFFLIQSLGFYLVFLQIVLVVINISFYFLLKTPTERARKILDEIEGYAMYLTMTDTDELLNDLKQVPPRNLFRKYLPYAMALNIEESWVKRFDGIIDDLGIPLELPTWITEITDSVTMLLMRYAIWGQKISGQHTDPRDMVSFRLYLK